MAKRIATQFMVAPSLVALLLLGGCAPCDCDLPLETSTGSPVATPETPEAPEATTGADYGQIGRETVTDEFGSYQRDSQLAVTTSWSFGPFINLNDPAVATAQELALSFALNEAIDSIALDNAAAWETWKAEVAPKYFHSETINDILENRQTEGYEGPSQYPILSVAIPGPENSELAAVSSLVRDGGPRTVVKSVDFTNIDWSSDENFVVTYTVQLNVYGQLRVSDADHLAWLSADLQLDCSNGECENLVISDPRLRDGIPGYIGVNARQNFYIQLDGDVWRIKNVYSEFYLWDAIQ